LVLSAYLHFKAIRIAEVEAVLRRPRFEAAPL
jgi:hypothetical protein